MIPEIRTGRNELNSQRWERLKSILADALEQESPAARIALIERSCADDDALLREAESLLAEAELLLHDAKDHLEECADNAATRIPREKVSEIGRRVGAYVIVREIGQGGMGTVYLAARADGYFEKQVAMKLLSRGTDTAEVLCRFRSEREVLARLDHPNIARLLDAGTTDDGLPYFLMEYVDGIPVTRFVEENGLSVKARVHLFLKICSAVEFAHRSSVVHRDLKSSNILVSHDGEPKLLDFGIAKLIGGRMNPLELTASGDQRLTPISASPEQAQGELVTISSDIYALGALLYELLSGCRPHRFSTRNPSRAELVSVLCEQEPALPSSVVGDVRTKRLLRGDMDAIILCALQKEPARRYLSVVDFANDLQRYLAGEVVRVRESQSFYRLFRGALNNRGVQFAAAALAVAVLCMGVLHWSSLLGPLFKWRGLEKDLPATQLAVTRALPDPNKSIAVLPFENLSANQETAFFADGIQGEILTDLAKVADLKVISRISVMQYKADRKRNLREIAQQLGVSHILEGSVQRIDNRIRVNAQLIDARNDAHVWAQIYDRDLADVFAIQSEIAKAIAEQLQAKISLREQEALSQAATTDLVAEKLFVQARELVALASEPDAKETLLQAARLLDEAVARDPHFLRAYGYLATVHLDLYCQGFDHTDARRELAHQVVEAAARVAPDAGEVHLMRANYVYQGFRDYDRARAELDLARRRLPNNAAIYVFTASIDRRQGRWAEAIRNFESAVDLDPRNFRFLEETAFTYHGWRRFSEASQFYERALNINPRDYFARTQLAQIPFAERADPEPLRAQVSAILNEDPKAATEIANGLFDCALALRNPSGVTRALQAIRPEGLRDPLNNSLWARDWFVGLAARTFGNEDRARAAFSAARAIDEKAVLDQPDYAPAWSRLGLIDAGLGRKDEAIREGRRACELLPLSKDAWDGASYIINLAMIYAWVGEKDLALEQLALAAHVPNGVTYGELKLYPQWDSLRGDPHFEKILASLAPKPQPARHE
jgi:eukaryotic-like serine/threonine-protein kinase